jgi:hypothetical protein
MGPFTGRLARGNAEYARRAGWGDLAGEWPQECSRA